MEFLFVVLMSVLVGASALPHVLENPNDPSFSLRKKFLLTVGSLPKVLNEAASLQSKLAAIEGEQQKRKAEKSGARQIASVESTP